MSHQMKDTESFIGQVAPTDADNEVIATLPSGATVTFTSSDPATVGVEPVDGQPLQCKITSVKVGTASVTAHIDGMTRKDGTPVPDETLDFEVVNSEPNALNFSVGDPIPE